jgi:hypothetical protein
MLAHTGLSGAKGILITPSFDVENKILKFSFDMYRYSTTYYEYPQEGVNIYISPSPNISDATLVKYVPRCRNLAPVESLSGWYNYSEILNTTGLTTAYIIIEGMTNHGYSTFIDNIKLEETFAVTAAVNNSDWGGVSINKHVITATPNSCAGYATPAYSITPEGAATVIQNGNEFAVTNVTTELTVTINFALISPYTVTLHAGSGMVENDTLTEVACGVGVTLPTPDLPSCAGWSFAGWTTDSIVLSPTVSTTLYPAGIYHPVDNVDLWAVYKQENTGGSLTIDRSKFPSGTGWEVATWTSNTTTDETITGQASIWLAWNTI